MVHEPKKQFYKRFLYEPFPVESSLHEQVRGRSRATRERMRGEDGGTGSGEEQGGRGLKNEQLNRSQ